MQYSMTPQQKPLMLHLSTSIWCITWQDNRWEASPSFIGTVVAAFAPQGVTTDLHPFHGAVKADYPVFGDQLVQMFVGDNVINVVFKKHENPHHLFLNII